MDHQFDVLTRIFATCTSRRQALALLAAMTLGSSRPGRAAAQAETPTCDAGLTYCPDAGACVDLLSDLNNCGACDEICESGLVPVECRSGVCERATCPVGIEYCGAVDGCRDLSSDPEHCGACANACASGVCNGGVCAGGGSCAEGQADCGGVCVDTCCNNQHCGACGNVCPPGETCFEGICGCPSGLCCAEGEVNCNGTCVATCCDNNNCGACGNVCKNGLTCFEGLCDCPSGKCPPVKLPNTGSGGADMGGFRDRWLAAALTGAATVSALLWRGGADSAGRAGSEDS